MIASFTEFVSRCLNATNDEIYQIFEFETAENVRDQVYAFADPASSEPFRSAMCRIGFVNY